MYSFNLNINNIYIYINQTKNAILPLINKIT
jgi:hypothetical protein